MKLPPVIPNQIIQSGGEINKIISVLSNHIDNYEKIKKLLLQHNIEAKKIKEYLQNPKVKEFLKNERITDLINHPEILKLLENMHGGETMPSLGPSQIAPNSPVKFKPGDACSHNRQNADNTLTCYTNPELKKIAKSAGINPNIGEKALVKKITEVKKTECGKDQACWAKSNPELVQVAFKPVVPDGKFTWLNTTNIQHVMEQFEKKHNDFKYLGTVAINFKDYHPVFKNLNLSKYYSKNLKKLGIVFNTDKNYQRGQHWISMFVDLDKEQINFFDSYGNERPVPTEIDELAATLTKQGKTHGLNLKYSQNKSVFQRKNSECGVYCLYFLKTSLDGVSFDDFTKRIVSDDEVNQYRVHKGWASFFRPKKVPVGEV